MPHILAYDPSFCRGAVDVPSLGLRIPLKPNERYRQELVPNVEQRLRELNREWNFNRQAEGHSPLGCSVYFTQNVSQPRESTTAYIQLITAGLDPINHVHTVAHENGHFLEFAGRKRIIYEGLGTGDLGYTGEAFAELCGYIGLHRAGIDIRTIEPGVVNPSQAKDAFTSELVRRTLVHIIEMRSNRARSNR